MDLIKNVDGPKGVFDKMIRRKPNDPAWYEGGLYHDDMPFGAPSMWFVSWYDVSTGPNIALFNHVRANATDTEVANNQYLVIAPTLHCGYRRATEETIDRHSEMIAGDLIRFLDGGVPINAVNPEVLSRG